MEKLRDKIKGLFAGLMLGDALGAPYEFRYNRKFKYTGKLDTETRVISRFKGTYYRPAGIYTDDSEMTLALVDALLKSIDIGGINILDEKYEDIAIINYIEWANSGTTFMGRNTRDLFVGIKAKNINRQLATFNGRWDKKFSTTDDQFNAQSNGSLMRAAPMGILPLDNHIYVFDCRISNPSTINIIANEIYTTIVHHLIFNINFDVHKFIQQFRNIGSDFENFDILINELESAKSSEIASLRDVTATGKGWVLHALYCGLYYIFHQDEFITFDKLMEFIINLSGDTDTNAAIAGALYGAHNGFQKIMETQNMNDNWEILLKVNNSANKNHKYKYCIDNLESVVDRLTDISMNYK